MNDEPPTPERTPSTHKSGPKSGLLLIGAGTMFAAMILSGFLLGYWVDVWLDTNPLFMLAFGGLGLVGGILKVHRLLT